MKVVQSGIELIGETPIQILNQLSGEDTAKVWAKLELQGPGSSIKDRIALHMIRDAENKGLLLPQGTVIEATAGNTGIGLSIVAAAMNYEFICIMPEKFSIEKQKVMEFLGGKVIRTPTEDGIKGALAKAYEVQAGIPGAWVVNQFENQANPECHYQTTGKEIWEQTQGRVTHIAIGAGTGGSFTGISRFLKEKNPRVKAYVVEPVGSVIGGGEKGEHWVEGIGNSFIPDTLDMSLADGVLTISDEDSKAMVKKLALQEQLLVGGSSGANVSAALEIAKDLGPEKIVVTLIPDRLERYISKGILDL
jgi:cysteine synthase A